MHIRQKCLGKFSKTSVVHKCFITSILRVNGPFSNMKQFAEDFECSSDAKMNSEQKCEVW